MRGALTDATLPVVMRRTCVCPSRLLSTAVNCLVIVGFAVKVGVEEACMVSLRTGMSSRTGTGGLWGRGLWVGTKNV